MFRLTSCLAVLVSVGQVYGGIFTILDLPGIHSGAQGIDGNNIVGWYSDGDAVRGFLFDGTTYTTIDVPGAELTAATGIDGNNIVGEYDDGSKNVF